MPTTVEELPAGFWDDEEASAAPPAPPPAAADRRPTAAAAAPSPRPAPAPTPAPPPPGARPAGDPAARPDGSPPALASLQGLALLQAVFPGRVVKVERTANPDDDAVPGEAAAAGPVDPTDDDLDPGADASPPRTP